jgi:hypothetical protein
VKPAIVRNVEANQKALERAIGPRLGRLFSPRPGTSRFGAVLIYPQDRVVRSGSLARALRKLRPTDRPVLVFAHCFTLEARAEAVAEPSCELISESDFAWTDATYDEIRKPVHTWAPTRKG